MITGSLTLHKRLPSLRIQARSLRYSAVLANRAGSQSTYKLRRQGLSSGWDSFPSELLILLAPLIKIRTISIIQGCERIFTDQGVSGATIEREGLSQAIAAVGKGDVLVVWKLDRLGRSLSFLIELIDKLRKDQAGFESLSDGINTTTAGGKLVFHIMAHWPSSNVR